MMMRNLFVLFAFYATFIPWAIAQTLASPVSSHSTREWVMLGEALHGGFGTHIAVGVRIGEDALRVLKSQRRGVEVIVTEGRNAPCACVADGVALAVSASPGQRSLTVLPKSQDASFLALVEIRNRASGDVVVYRIPESAMEPLLKMNMGASPEDRFERVMGMPVSQLFSLTLQPKKVLP